MADSGFQGFEVDPEVLARHAADFPRYADRLGAIHDELTSALAAAGQCWGDDAAGQSFAASHVWPADDTIGRLAALPGQVSDVGDRFATTATRYQQADEHGVELLGDGER